MVQWILDIGGCTGPIRQSQQWCQEIVHSAPGSDWRQLDNGHRAEDVGP